jgi:hypothetical protein
MKALDVVRKWYRDIAPDVVVEFQPDDGFFSDEFRGISPGYWYGVETWAPAVVNHGLWDKYDRLILSDIRHLDFNSIYAIPDLVIMGDVLPHMAAEEAMVMLDKVKVWADNLIVSVPIDELPHHDTQNWTYGHQSYPTLRTVADMLGPGLRKVVAGDGYMYFLWRVEE